MEDWEVAKRKWGRKSDLQRARRKGKARKKVPEPPDEELVHSPGWFLSADLTRLFVTVSDQDDIGCTCACNSREDVRALAAKVRKLPHHVLAAAPQLRWHPGLLALGFESWN